ncbi:MAG: hypothetical protein ABIF71_02890, partial [Planctomycetota bacterium]
MHQMLLPGFPVGAIRVGAIVSILKKDGYITYFVGSDNYFSHLEDDDESARFAIADHRRRLRMPRAELGAMVLDNDGHSIQVSAERLQDIQRLKADTDQLRAQRHLTPRK